MARRLVNKTYKEIINPYSSDIHILPDIVEGCELHENLRITTITLNGNLNNCTYDDNIEDSSDEYDVDKSYDKLLEQPFFDAVTKTLFNDSRIHSYSSGPTSLYASSFINENLNSRLDLIKSSRQRESTSNKGRLRHNRITKSFQSQTTVKIMSNKYPDFKTYNIKVFKPGNIGIPGVHDIEDAFESLDYWINKMNKFVPEPISVSKLHISMCNYKTHINKVFNDLPSLNEYLSVELGQFNPTYDKISSTNCVALSCSYNVDDEILRHDSKNLNFVKNHIHKFESTKDAEVQSIYAKEKTIKKESKKGNIKKYRIEIYASGKIGVKGNCPYYHVLDTLYELNRLLVNYKTESFNDKSPEEINRLFETMSDEFIIYH